MLELNMQCWLNRALGSTLDGLNFDHDQNLGEMAFKVNLLFKNPFKMI